jgi:hypothetical protein
MCAPSTTLLLRATTAIEAKLIGRFQPMPMISKRGWRLSGMIAEGHHTPDGFQ